MSEPTARPNDARVVRARELVAECEDELKRGRDGMRAARLHYEAARLLESPIGDLEAAALHYEASFAVSPEHLPTVQGTRRVFLALRRIEEAIPLFDAEIRLVADARLKAQLTYEKARWLEDELGLEGRAREAFETAVSLDPTHLPLIDAAERAARRAEDWAALDRLLALAADAVRWDGRLRSTLLARRARLAEVKSRDLGTATELYRESIEADPRSLVPVRALARLLESQARWSELAKVLEIEATLVVDYTARAALLYRVAQIQEQRLNSLTAALSAMESAAKDLPEDNILIEELARLYFRTEKWELLAETLEKLLARTSTQAARLATLERLAQIHEEKLSDEQQAISWYERALDTEPLHAPALEALTRLYTKRGAFDKLVVRLTSEAAATHDMSRRAAAQSRIAEIQERHLEQAEQAVETYARALGSFPGHAPSFKALVRLYTQAGRHRELVELYERGIDWTTDPELIVAYLFQVGRIQEDVLGQPASAVASYRRILDVEPGHLGAIHALQRAAERSLKFEELIHALELEADRLADRERVLPLLFRAAEVSDDALGDVDGALARYRRVLELDSGYVPALLGLGRLHARLGRWEELLEIHKKQLAVTPRGAASAALLHSMAIVCEERLGRSEEAIALWQEAVRAEPRHRPARVALGKKLAERAAWPELVGLLEAELGTVEGSGDRARLALSIGEVYENRLAAPDTALAWYERALEADENLLSARDARRRLLTGRREFRAVVGVLEDEARTARDVNLVVAARAAQAELYLDELASPSQSIEAYEAVLERDPSNVPALIALEELYASDGQWDKLARVLVLESRVVSDVGARVAALRRLARLQETRGLGAPGELKQSYLAILQLAPDDLAALRALEAHALRHHDRQLLVHIDAKLGSLIEEPRQSASHLVRLAEALEDQSEVAALDTYRTALAKDPDSFACVRGLARMARRSEDPELLELVAEREATVSQDPDSAAQLLVKSADLRGTRGDWAGAVRTLERALEVNPEHRGTVDRLHDALLARGEVDRLVDRLSHAAHSSRSPDAFASLWLRVARLHAQHRRDVPAALAVLRRVTGELPTHVTALLELAELYATDTQWLEAKDALERALSLNPLEDIAQRARLKLASVFDDRLGLPERALEVLTEVLTIQPDQREALGRALDIHARSGRLDEAARMATRLAKTTSEPAVRAAVLTRLAKLERARNDLRGALDAHEEAVALIGIDGNSAREMRELLVELRLLGEEAPWRRYVAALGRHLERSGRPNSPLVLEMASVLDTELSRPEEAIRVLRDGIARERGDVDLRIALAGLLAKARAFDQSILELRHALDLDPMRPEAWRDLAQSFRSAGRIDEARLSLLPLVVLGGAVEIDHAMLAGRVPRPASAPPGAFDAQAFRAVDPLPAQDATSDLLSSIAEVLGRLVPPELERWGVSARDRIPARAPNPLRQIAERVASEFGQIEFDLYVHEAHAGGLEVELTEPVSVLIPRHLTALGEAQLTFLFARIFANVVRGLHAVDKLPPESIAALLSAAARSYDPGYSTPLLTDAELDQQARRIGRAMGWRSRRVMEDAAQRFAALRPAPDFARWVEHVRIAAARAALILADDLPGSVALVRRYEADLSGAQGPLLGRGMALLHDLLRYWVSEPAMTLRRRLGVI